MGAVIGGDELVALSTASGVYTVVGTVVDLGYQGGIRYGRYPVANVIVGGQGDEVLPSL